MADRPLGVDPAPSREFFVRVAEENKLTFREKINEEWYYLKNFSFRRGSIIELELDDDMIEFLITTKWIKKRGRGFYFTRKGSRELIDFAEKEIRRINSLRTIAS